MTCNCEMLNNRVVDNDHPCSDAFKWHLRGVLGFQIDVPTFTGLSHTWTDFQELDFYSTQRILILSALKKVAWEKRRQ